jgi:U4/U6.U5 tri-snRNP-associated protein 2
MDSSDKLSRAIDGTMYLPGIVGLNNIKANDYCNVILQVRNFSRATYIFIDSGKNFACGRYGFILWRKFSFFA